MRILGSVPRLSYAENLGQHNTSSCNQQQQQQNLVGDRGTFSKIGRIAWQRLLGHIETHGGDTDIEDARDMGD
jgi:hypothetical protein